VICPGYINTEMVQAVPKEVLEKIVMPQIPVNRLGEPKRSRARVVFLAADEAGFITGSTLTINGGQLFWAGRITTASRRGFERLYDLTERVLPRAVLDAPVPDTAEAQRQLLAISARALGIATEPDLRDYFRLRPEDSKARLAELVEAGALLPVAVKGWAQPAYLDPTARLPRKVAARTLCRRSIRWCSSGPGPSACGISAIASRSTCPRRSGCTAITCCRSCWATSWSARVDLKADRANRVLQVPAAHLEGHADPAVVAPELHAALVELAAWLGLERIEIGGRGDLCPSLRHHAPGAMRAEPVSQNT
jgi:hypothetical protein